MDTTDIAEDDSSKQHESESENNGENLKLDSDSIDKEISTAVAKNWISKNKKIKRNNKKYLLWILSGKIFVEEKWQNILPVAKSFPR